MGHACLTAQAGGPIVGAAQVPCTSKKPVATRPVVRTATPPRTSGGANSPLELPVEMLDLSDSDDADSVDSVMQALQHSALWLEI